VDFKKQGADTHFGVVALVMAPGVEFVPIERRQPKHVRRDLLAPDYSITQ
jgi:hypothetical protein